MVRAAAAWLDSGLHSEKKKKKEKAVGSKPNSRLNLFSLNICKIIGGQLVVCMLNW